MHVTVAHVTARSWLRRVGSAALGLAAIGAVVFVVNPASVARAITGFHLALIPAIIALTVAFYQNIRTASDYVKWGPVPGVSVRCGHVQPNVIAVLRPSDELLAAVVASVTIRF